MRCVSEKEKVPAGLDSFRLADYAIAAPAAEAPALGLSGLCEEAERVLTRTSTDDEPFSLELTPESERLRWFLLPQEAQRELEAGQTLVRAV